MLRQLLVAGFVVTLVACGGGDGDGADAAIDSSVSADAVLLVDRLDVEIDGMTVCPGGWTTPPTAVQEDANNRIRVRASCSTNFDEVLILFSPLPPSGTGAVTCFQATLQIMGGARVNCRQNSAVLMDPGGQIVIDSPQAGYVQGTCSCTGDDMGSAATGGANMLLTLN